jgi:hypothetical protein
MNRAAFQQSLQQASPPDGLTPALRALWWDGKDDWEKAHGCVDHEGGQDAARVHAYLHRKEGDLANAGYWYRSAGAAVFKGSLAEEWAVLVAERVK